MVYDNKHDGNTSLRTVAFIDAGQFRPGVIMNRLELPNGRRFDWSKFRSFLNCVSGSPLLDAHYFDSVDPSTIERQVNFHQFLRNQLSFQLHFSGLKEKRRKCPECDCTYEEIEQKGVDVSLTISMLKLAYNNAYDQALLCTGDGDFAPLASFIRDSLGKRVIVLGWSNGVAPALRDAAHSTITLNDYTKEFIGDNARSTPAKNGTE